MRCGLLKELLWVNAGIKIVVCQSIWIILGVASLRVECGDEKIGMLIQSEEVQRLMRYITLKE